MSDESALVRHQAGQLNPHQFEPNGFDELKEFAHMVCRSGLFGRRYEGDQAKQATILSETMTVLVTGRELGLSAMRSLSGVHVIEGKPSLSGELMLAMCKRSDVCEYFMVEDSSPTSCTVAAKRKGEPKERRATWTIEMVRAQEIDVYDEVEWKTSQSGKRYPAKTGNKIKKDTWKKYPHLMLKWRAVSEVARDTFGDVIGGMYATEELRDGPQFAEEYDTTGPVTVEAVVDPVPDSESTNPKPEPSAAKQDNPAQNETQGPADSGAPEQPQGITASHLLADAREHDVSGKKLREWVESFTDARYPGNGMRLGEWLRQVPPDAIQKAHAKMLETIR